MTDAEHLRGMAKDHLIAGNEHTADALLAGADALDTRAHAVITQSETIQTLSRLLTGAEQDATERAEQIERVRTVLDAIARKKADSDAAIVYGHDNPDWHIATADALEYALDLITEALEGDTK